MLFGRFGLASRADTVELQRVTRDDVARARFRFFLDGTQNGNHHVVHTPALGAADVVVRKRLVVEVVRTVVDLYLEELALIGKPVQRAVDRGLADARVLRVDRLVNLIGGGMVGEGPDLVLDDGALDRLPARYLSLLGGSGAPLLA